ncbi:hypothetical protein CTAM01_11927 [Colletotrichum tamarilloi]|uniref:Uncharacterized protein n=1 Tax=Colletotrichum tamarilloi TaxID=1209934 RepID=A0ABQ9QWK5_9PEZI|nr:uncharacterized protein CTAM01_11927 [Colletotrichum tamarilloi]KAK1487156.1 hypothetical protein CTAM01_11927 [Colletotrichum tamarilloi]
MERNLLHSSRYARPLNIPRAKNKLTTAAQNERYVSKRHGTNHESPEVQVRPSVRPSPLASDRCNCAAASGTPLALLPAAIDLTRTVLVGDSSLRPQHQDAQQRLGLQLSPATHAYRPMPYFIP